MRLGGSLEVSVGNVETVDGGRQVFGGVTRAQTDITASDPAYPGNRAPGATTKVTAFTDGCPGLCTARRLCQTIPCLETGLVHRPEAR